MAKRKRDHPMVWTWREGGLLSPFTEPLKSILWARGKPSPEAKLVCVRLVPNVEYRARRRREAEVDEICRDWEGEKPDA